MKEINLLLITVIVSLATMGQQTFKTLDEAKYAILGGYKLQNGWTIKDGDTVQLGKGTMPNKYFAFIYQSPTGYVSQTSMDGYNRRALTSSNANHTAKVKDIFPYGSKKTGYTILLKIGVGEMVNYWVEVDNAVEALEVVPPDEYKVKAATAGTPAGSMADELKKLKELYDTGALTKEEYEAAKKKILN